MALIVENGSIVAGANTYVTLAELVAYATQRGYGDKVEDDDNNKAALIVAMDYLNTIYYYKGTQVSSAQALPWPRQNVLINGAYLLLTSIPNTLKYAQCELALAHLQGFKLFPNQGVSLPLNGQVKKKKVGPIETEFFEKGDSSYEELELPYVDRLLEQLLYQGPMLRTIRV